MSPNASRCVSAASVVLLLNKDRAEDRHVYTDIEDCGGEHALTTFMDATSGHQVTGKTSDTLVDTADIAAANLSNNNISWADVTRDRQHEWMLTTGDDAANTVTSFAR